MKKLFFYILFIPFIMNGMRQADSLRQCRAQQDDVFHDNLDEYEMKHWYECPDCTDKFDMETTLKDHIFIYHSSHSSSGTFICSECGLTCVRQAGLTKHKSAKHN